MADAISIRQAEDRDRAALEQCFCALQAVERAIEPNRADPQSISRQYIDQLAADCQTYRGAIFVAEAGGEVVGFVGVLARRVSHDLCERDREYAYVTDLFVAEPFRRTGVGGRLMRAAEDFARNEGARRIQVAVLAANAGAHRLYLQLGYVDNAVVLQKEV